MANHQYPKTRKATAVVKCPHCSHTGSARGLFQHVRMSHPTIAEKPATSTIITAHPLDVKGLGHVKDKVHRLDKKQLSFLDGVIVPLATALFIKLMEEYTLPSKVEKPYSSAFGSIEPKKKRKYYGE